MAFSNYVDIESVLRKHNLRWDSGSVVAPAKDAPEFGAYFRAELQLSLDHLTPSRTSEIGAGEIILFPILREIWKSYRDQLSLFTHEELAFDGDLCGYPDYFFCRITEFGRIPDAPYLLVVEAKLDDFEKAWGQCLAAMLAAQKLNQTPDRPVFGIASNGRSWEFGRLLHREFLLDQNPVSLANLETLSQTLHAVFRECYLQAREYNERRTAV